MVRCAELRHVELISSVFDNRQSLFTGPQFCAMQDVRPCPTEWVAAALRSEFSELCRSNQRESLGRDVYGVKSAEIPSSVSKNSQSDTMLASGAYPC